jgi:transcriptional regulator with XRE-family HTH domain
VPVIPSRIREARIERGLSLADLAGGEVSRAFIHQLEQGLARPSIQVLEMIASRTGKSVTYFTSGLELPRVTGTELPGELVALSKRLERLASTLNLSEANKEAFRLVVNSLRHGARLVAAVTREREALTSPNNGRGQAPG